MNILLISDGIVHPPLLGRYWLKRQLSRMQGLRVRSAKSLEVLPSLEMSASQAIVLYIHHNTISTGALSALDDYVTSGGGLLAIHSATASFKDCPEYFKILGGRFTGHGPVEAFQVSPSAPDDEIFGPVGSFTVTDELYLHELEPDIRAHYYAEYQGERAPMIWTRQHGQGRVCYACPGHRASTMRIVEYQRILESGLRWVAKEIK